MKREPTQPAADRGSHWEEEEQQLLERLSRRIDSMLELYYGLFAIDPRLPEEEVRRETEKLRQQLLDLFPQEAKDGMEQYHALQEQMWQLQESRQAILDEHGWDDTDMESYEDPAILRLDDEQDKLGRQLAAYRQDDDVRFLSNIEQTIENLLEKNKYLHAVGFNKQAIVADLERFGCPIPPEAVVKVKGTPFDAAIILKEGAYDEVAVRHSQGVHLRHTPYTLVRYTESREALGDVMAHERLHNLFDSAEGIRAPRASLGEALRDRIHSLRFFVHEKPMLLLAKNAAEAIVNKRPSFYLDNVQEELLAEAGAAHVAGFGLSGPRKPERVSADFIFAVNSLATAGRELEDLVTTLESAPAIAEYHEPWFEEACKKHADDIRRATVQLASELRKDFGITDRLGEEAGDELVGLLVLLRPSQYRHIERFLEYRHGKEAVQQAAEQYRFVEEFDFHKEALAKQVERLRSGAVRLTDYDVSMMVDQVSSLNRLTDAGILALASLDECRSYISELTALLELMGVKDAAERAHDSVLPAFLFQELRARALGGFEGVQEIYHALDDDEKPLFVEQCKKLLRRFQLVYTFNRISQEKGLKLPEEFLADIAPAHAVLDSGSWPALTELGLEQELKDWVGKRTNND